MKPSELKSDDIFSRYSKQAYSVFKAERIPCNRGIGRVRTNSTCQQDFD